ncbi:MAG: bifunctional homocysteine S-methyltransferase/methylenetetrahydrofolate reductase [Armatimonadetes bacterium]|nr:bifunctional homocysteine S-methyltransferase/methylenetetrahydrofolate reductase [Armatimonadota bacterium]
MKHPFLERIARGPVICDGAMGTVLYAHGVSLEYCVEEVNLSNPKLVQEIHRDYMASGAEVVETNTYGANRFHMASHGLEDKVHRVNVRGVKIAREAREIAGLPVFVAGSIGPINRPLEPIGQITYAQAADAFREQAEALLEGGIDLFILETFSNLRELTEAVKVVKNLCGLPIVAQMSFTEDGSTVMGQSPEEIVGALSGLEVDVIGVNCNIGPQLTLDVLQQMMASRPDMIYSAQPNAGFPQMVEGRVVYMTGPDYFADFARSYVEMGVSLIGGCCGTTPDHIRAMARAVGERKTAEPIREAVRVVPKPESPREAAPAMRELSGLGHKLRGKFAISVEIDPPKGINPAKALAGAAMLKERGVDTINIADSPMARVRMGCLAMAYLIEKQVGMETIVHFTCRDRNLMGIQSELMGAHAAGIRNILALTGDPTRLGDYPGATDVFDVDSIGLIGILRRMNEGFDMVGNSIGQQTSFLIGCAANPAHENLGWELERFQRKVAAGAHFVMTQPLYEIETLDRFLEKVSDFDLPILLGILPLQSYRQAEFLHNEVPGIEIPKWARDRMRDAGESAQRAGIEMAQELLLEARDKVAGVYLMPSFGRYEVVAEVIQALEPES